MHKVTSALACVFLGVGAANAGIMADFAGEFGSGGASAGWSYVSNVSGTGTASPISGYYSLGWDAVNGKYDDSSAANYSVGPVSNGTVAIHSAGTGWGQYTGVLFHATPDEWGTTTFSDLTLTVSQNNSMLYIVFYDAAGTQKDGWWTSSLQAGTTYTLANLPTNIPGMGGRSVYLQPGGYALVAVASQGGAEDTHLQFKLDNVNVVPEPASLSLLGGLGSAFLIRRRGQG